MTTELDDPDENTRMGVATPSAAHIDPSLTAALALTMDNIAVGVIIVAEDLRILHANHAARQMFNARSPIVSLGDRLVALRAELTNELKQAIAHITQSGYRQCGIGLPLINRDLTAAAAYIMPMQSCASPGLSGAQAAASIFVTSASQASRVDLSTIGRTFRLTAVEGRLLRCLVLGRSLAEAADELGVGEPAATSLQSEVFAKMGVSRLTDLMILVGHLVPPIFQAQRF